MSLGNKTAALSLALERKSQWGKTKKQQTDTLNPKTLANHMKKQQALQKQKVKEKWHARIVDSPNVMHIFATTHFHRYSLLNCVYELSDTFFLTTELGGNFKSSLCWQAKNVNIWIYFSYFSFSFVLWWTHWSRVEMLFFLFKSPEAEKKEFNVLHFIQRELRI